MAKTGASTTPGPVSGLPLGEGPRWHFDIYAMLEGSQELYFGSEVAVNVNLVETVEVAGDNGETIEKCLIAPTKRRGVERRTLIWAPRADGTLLGDALGCGIPDACARPSCPICGVYGALRTGKGKTAYVRDGVVQSRDVDPTTFVGRLTHGGGVAVQPQEAAVKQRAMHPSKVLKHGEDNPTPFRREYNQPGLFYPVYNHCLSITEAQFAAVAYAFLNVLPRIGAGNPKGARIAAGSLLEPNQPLLVVDRYRAPLGSRPTISPSTTDVEEARSAFAAQAINVHGANHTRDTIYIGQDGTVLDSAGADAAPVFSRWIGAAAVTELERRALDFTTRVLLPADAPGLED